MSNLNHIVLLGIVTDQPKTKFGMENNTSMSSFTLAVDRPARQDGTTDKDFIPVVAWGKSADYAAEKVKPNTLLIVEGRIHVRPVEQNGQRQWTTEVYASALKTIGGGGTSVGASTAPAAASVPETVGQNPFTEDDVPF